MVGVTHHSVYWDQISYLRGILFPTNDKNNPEKENKITSLYPFCSPNPSVILKNSYL